MTATTVDLSPVTTAPAADLLGFDHLEWWVGNARHAAHFWAAAFGFTVVAYAGPETGLADRQSYVVRQGELTFVLTSALDPDSEVAHHVARHGDGVRDVAYRVADAATAFDRSIARGAAPVLDPTTSSDLVGSARRATVAAYGDTVHSFVERDAFPGPFLPGFEPLDLPIAGGDPVGLRAYDHVVANVEQGRLDQWVDWYRDVFGFDVLQSFGEDAIATEFSALRSTVVWNHGRVVQPINEPATGRKKSQIEEFLDYHGSPGVQHVAMATDDIVATVAELRRRGVRFMRVPGGYYDEAPERLAGLGADLPWERLAELGILVDRDHGGYLLQIFTEPVASRPTVFMEIIQRHGAKGFGEGNFKALFTSIEAEQARRGNL
jgi:4-hydroxyphenylpyruvate dioxygenase